MLIKNKVYLLSNLNSLRDLLENDEIECLSRCNTFYGDKIAIQYILINNKHVIRIWKTKVLFDYWYNDFINCGKNLIGTIDYTILESFIKIQHLYINDSSSSDNLYNYLLDENESEDLVKSLVHYIKKIAFLLDKKRITYF